MNEKRARLFIGFEDYFYGCYIPESMMSLFDDLSEIFDENDIVCVYHGKGHEGEKHKVNMWTESI